MVNRYAVSGLVLVCVLFLASCTHNPCNPKHAQWRGQGDARSWNPANPSARSGGRCEKEYTYEQFRKDYLASFNSSLGNACSAEAAAQKGRTAAENFQGREYGFVKQYCPKGVRKALVSSYRRAYKGRKKQVCSGSSVGAMARSDARSGTNRVGTIRRFCPAAARAAYHAAYQSEQIEMLNAQLARREAIAKVTASCQVERASRTATVFVTNHGNSTISLRGRWAIRYFGKKRRPVGTGSESEWLSVWSGATERFAVSMIPEEARFCEASYMGD